MIVNFPISKQLKSLSKVLLFKGDELRLVGGCVRDFLADKKISDTDLACKYKPDKIIDLLKKNNIKVIPTGIKHGTVTAVIDGKHFEITTLRKDIKTDGRRAEVEFVDDFYLDAKRRDFTINAMSIDFSGELHDYFGGREDLENKTVKFIGKAENRIKEDYLRILRFFRLSCYYADSLDDKGLNASIEFKDQINNLSADRIRGELIKIISCNNRINLIMVLSMMQENNISIANKFNLQYLKNLFFLEDKIGDQSSYLFRFASLIFDQKDQSLQITKDLNFSNKDQRYINSISNPGFDVDLAISNNELISLLFDYDQKIIIDSFLLFVLSDSNLKLDRFLEIRQVIQNTKIPHFPIGGNDLLKINVPAKKRGKLLKMVRDYWVKNDFSLSRKELLEFLKASFKK